MPPLLKLAALRRVHGDADGIDSRLVEVAT
jgi:hypothetical protein